MRDDTDWTRAQLLAQRLAERVTAYWTAGIQQEVLDPAALAEADELRAFFLRAPTPSTTPPTTAPNRPLYVLDRSVLSRIAALHYARCTLLGPDTPEGRPETRLTLTLYGVISRFTPDQVPEELRASITAADATADLPPVEDLEAAAVRALELFGRWQAAGDETALETATTLWRDMENLLPPPWPGRPMVLSNLCSALRFRYLVRGNEADLEESVALGREAVRLAPADDPNRAMYLANLSGSLSVRYGLHKDPADLDLAVDTGRDSVRAAPAPQPLYHSNAGFALLLRHDRNKPHSPAHDQPNPYDQTNPYGQTTTADQPDPHDHTTAPDGTAPGQTAADDDLDAAVEEFRQAVRHAPTADPQRPMYLANLGHALHRRFRRHGQETDLDTGVDAAARAVTDCPPGHPARPGYLLRLSDILRSRAEQSGTATDLDAAVDTAREALTAVPPTSPDHPTATQTLGLALRLRHERLHRQADLDESTALLPRPPASDSLQLPATSPITPAPLIPWDTENNARDAVASAASAAPPDFATMEVRMGTQHLHDQAAALLERFRDTGNPADLDEAIDTARQARLGKQGRTGQRLSPSLLGEALYARAVRTDSPDDLDDAIDALRETNLSRAAHPDDPGDPDDPERIVDEAQLGRALLRRFGRTNAPDDLSEALTWNRRAAERITDDHNPYAHQVLSTLARTLQTIYEQSDDLDALDEAVRRLEEALHAGHTTGPDDPTTLSRLSTLLRTRAGRLGGRTDLDRSVDLSRQALTALPDGHPRQAAHLTALGAVLLQRHTAYGAQQDLADALQAYQEAADATDPDDTTAHATRLAALATALRRRYEHTGDPADLDAATDAHRSALSALPDDDPHSATHRTDLAVTLLTRHRHSGTPADLDDAIDAARAAADALPDEHPQRATCLANLALALRHRHAGESRRSDADEAVTRLRTAIRLTPENHPHRPIHQTNLSSALMARCTGGDPTTNTTDTENTPSATDTEDATEAAHAARAALRALPDDHPQRAACLTNIGAALLIRSHANGDHDDLGTACDAFRRATAITSAPASIRFRAARAWARAAITLQDWPQALDAHRAALTELPLPPWHGIDHGDRIPTPDKIADLAGDAAAVALNAGNPEEALSLLEHGRGIHLTHTLNTPSHLTDLHKRQPHLADRIHETRSLLQTPGPETHPATAADPTRLRSEQRVTAEQRHELAQELDELLTRARELPGLDDLLRPPTPHSLQTAAAHGPIVVVNTSPLRCDAIIVTTTGLRTVPLPDLHLHGDDGLTERATALHDALSPTDGSPPSTWRTQRLLTRTLAWLWDTVAAPVLTALDPTPPTRRLWWCPTGPLTRLPLHAAGHYDTANTDDRRALPDHYVCSYTTTLRTLTPHPTTTPAPTTTPSPSPSPEATLAFLPPPDPTATPPENIPLAATPQLTGTTHVVTAQWTVDETSTQNLTNDFHTALTETKDAPYALHEAVQRLRSKNSSPLTWAAYAHTGP